MKFIVEPEIFELFPGMRLVVAVADGLDNRGPNPDVEAMWRSSYSGAAGTATEFGNAQSHPRVAAWREAMGEIGVSARKFPSSIEAMLKRAGKGGEPFSINPLVDFYNAVSLKHVAPAGGFDLGKSATLWNSGSPVKRTVSVLSEGSPSRPSSRARSRMRSGIPSSPVISCGGSRGRLSSHGGHPLGVPRLGDPRQAGR